jgi:NTP pyrophosphatase (non-canonical NTP hydrolase)
MELKDLIQRAMDVRQQYAELEQATYGRPWTREEVAMGFVGDVGDLVKLIMAHSGVRDIPNAGQKLAHEVADCLWSIVVLSQAYGVDLERAFLRTMDALEQHIALQRRGEGTE